VPKNDKYKVLLLTCLEDIFDNVTTMTRDRFTNVESLFWEIGDKETKPAAIEQMEATDYNLIISFLNGLILKPNHLARASFGAVNIHPAPPEHPGLWGFLCQPVIRRDIRTHHGVTLHEVDEKIDHGPIYAVDRWEVGESDTIESVFDKAVEKSMEMLEFTLNSLAASDTGTKCFTQIDEQWDTGNAHHTIEDVQAWFRDLDPNHPAHQERIFFNHPKGMMAPPYFTDIE
jgi:methionyl-tRNA formyltransferase